MRIKGIAIVALALAFCFTGSLAWAGNIVIKGSTTVLPIAQKVAEAYMKQHHGCENLDFRRRFR